ncbi:MAG: PucR family transcriptional regulator, partial [Pseudonocardia sp.]|nr:PucR family transcriptional regulator [Pseudonocardia sp.]
MLDVLVQERSAQPRTVVKRIVDGLPTILLEVREVLAREHPHYAAFLDENLDEVLLAAREFVRRLFDADGREPGPDRFEAPAEQALFEEIGQVHCEQGQDIKGLLAAYRAGAAVAWRYISRAALGAGVATESVAALATVVFTAMDQLSSASLRGYERQLATYARARERCREELAQLLLSDRCDAASLYAAAERANWQLPRQAAVVLVEPPVAGERDQLARLDGNCLRM